MMRWLSLFVVEAKEAAINLMRNDLQKYLVNMGSQSTFKGWIAHICPENVTSR